MTPLRLQAFAGMVPRTSRHLLQDSQAQVATNARLTSGALEALHDVLLVAAPDVSNIQTIHRLPSVSDFWLAWDADVDVVRGPIAGDETLRTYYTGDFEPRVTDLALATGSPPFPDAFYVLGVFPPQTAASVSHAGGSGAAIDRAFCYTFVTQWGEESQPSPASALVTGKIDGTWTIGGTTAMETTLPNTFTVTGASWASGVATLTVASTRGLRVGEEIAVTSVNPSGYNTASAAITALTATTVSYALAANPGAYVSGGTITRAAPHNTTGMKKRIYWTETVNGVAQFQFVKEVDLADASTTIAGDADAGEVLPSTDWAMPPVGARGLALHPSGAMVAFDKNEILFSETHKPYAWPAVYRHTLDFKVVGVGISGSTVVAPTEGKPYLITGSGPETMTPTKVDQPWPCLAKRGIATFDYGVAYPCPQGIALVGANGAVLMTNDLYKQEEWLRLNPETLIATAYAGRYVASYEATPGQRLLLIIDKGEFASAVKANKHCTALYTDPTNGKLYVVIEDDIYEWDSLDAGHMLYDWMSKEYLLPRPVNIGAARVDADFGLSPDEIEALAQARAEIIASNDAAITAGTYEGSVAQTELGVLEIGSVDLIDLPLESNVLQFQLWINNELKFTKKLDRSRDFVLPAGYKADRCAIRLTGTVKVLGVVLAETMKGLARA